MTAQHGILKPNPVLFDLETRKKKPQLAHELGAGNNESFLGQEPWSQCHKQILESHSYAALK